MYDVIIVGAGPAGLTAGIYARGRKLETLMIDADKAGGQLISIYPNKKIENYPSHERILASELAKKMIEHAVESGAQLKEEEMVKELDDKGDKIVVNTNKSSYECRAVILTMGVGLFKPRRLGIPDEEKFESKGLYYRINNIDDFKGKKVLFVGGGNTALEMALSICNVCDITLIHRKDCFRADESNVIAIKESPINVMFKTELKSIHGKNKIEKAVVFNNQYGEEEKPDVFEEEELKVNAVVINVGFSPKLDFVEGWGLELDKGKIKVDTQMKTSKKGIFACGDVVTYEGKYMQIITACGEGATAAHSAYKYIKKPYWA